MGCGSSHAAADSNDADAAPIRQISVAPAPDAAPEESSTSSSALKKSTSGPVVKLSKAQELAAKKREEERQEEERRKRLSTVKLSEGPSVRTTRASEMARDSKANLKEASSPSTKAKTVEPTPIVEDRPTVTDADLVNCQIGKVLGRGSFGSTFECTLQTGLVCCVKVIEFGGIADPSEIANLRAEITLMKRLVHPHIVHYYGSTDDAAGKRILIFMELVGGGTLTQYLRQYQKVPRDLLKKWVRQMLLGVRYLHDSGVVHRDIKGANILMTTDGTIRLADFGCSKSIGETCSKTKGCSTMVGTPYWMAPEVLKSLPYGPKADIWSVGCTIVEMITGKPPWPEMPNMWAAVYKIANSNGPPPGIPKDIPKELARFLERSFERNPAFRATADELLQHPYLSESD